MPSIGLASAPRGRERVRYSNRVKVLICYLVCFAIPPLWLVAGLVLVYPYQLTGSAPEVLGSLINTFPVLKRWLSEAAAQAAAPAASSPEIWQAALDSRDSQWAIFLAAVFAAGWLLTLLCQLLWRCTHGGAYQAARASARAIRDYRLTQLIIWLVNGSLAAAVWLLGVQFIQGRTLWDYLVYFVPYGLNGLAALCCFRLAAPPALSGRHAFFKRL